MRADTGSNSEIQAKICHLLYYLKASINKMWTRNQLVPLAKIETESVSQIFLVDSSNLEFDSTHFRHLDRVQLAEKSESYARWTRYPSSRGLFFILNLNSVKVRPTQATP